jgi:hypothetical protein
MDTKGKFSGILSLSAASAALMQSSASSKESTVALQSSSLSTEDPNFQVSVQTGHLVLKPGLQDAISELYAGHTSHSSHASHSSGVGHSSHYSGTSYAYPSTPSYSAPRSSSAVYQSAPSYKPTTVRAVAATNAVPTATNQAPKTALETAEQANVDDLKKKAAHGSADAQYSLAMLYQHGWKGVKQDLERAKMLLELAAVQGYFPASTRLKELAEQTQSKPQPVQVEDPAK